MSELSSAFFGNTMPLVLTWADVCVRLCSAVLAGAMIGFNRTEYGKAAGLRTTILVCVAAALAMLQMNYLLALSGRPTDSFVMNDLMRLPLGILTGVGFIGGGAILRRGSLVIGVTTAATLWYVTVVGLCFGGGQVLLGWIATVIGFVVLWGLKGLENLMVTERDAELCLTADAKGPGEAAIRQYLNAGRLEVKDVDVAVSVASRTLTFRVRDFGKRSKDNIPAVIDELARQPGVLSLTWRHLE